MTTYHKYSANLSKGQQQRLAKAVQTRNEVTLRLGFDDLSGPYEMMLTKTQVNRLNKAKRLGKGVDLKLSKTQVRHMTKEGASLASLFKLGSKLLPYATKAVSKVLPGLIQGSTHALGSIGK